MEPKHNTKIMLGLTVFLILSGCTLPKTDFKLALSPNTNGANTAYIDQDFGKVAYSEIRISTHESNITIKRGSTNKRIIGEATYPSVKPNITFEVENGKGLLELISNVNDYENVTLHLPPDISNDIEIMARGSILKLDLKGLEVTRLRIISQISNANIRFSETTSIDAEIEVGTGLLRMHVPENAGLKLTFNRKAPDAQSLDPEYEDIPNGYRSKGYDEKDIRIDIKLMGSGTFEIKRYAV
ncbi:hypothetical protein HY640_03065 [Candidatus Woesearchaeota archaeon]|nr:hypothetical protein [Candidatus Woesearchaeota archaeon]